VPDDPGDVAADHGLRRDRFQLEPLAPPSCFEAGAEAAGAAERRGAQSPQSPAESPEIRRCLGSNSCSPGGNGSAWVRETPGCFAWLFMWARLLLSCFAGHEPQLSKKQNPGDRMTQSPRDSLSRPGYRRSGRWTR
jgi:hypothetical protein